MKDTKNEIGNILDTYSILDNFSVTNDDSMKNLIRNIKDKRFISFEKPDAFLEEKEFIYGIEHFQISLYKKSKKGDISKIAKGAQDNREKMSEDMNFILQPSIKNLLKGLDDNLKSHSKSFSAYRINLGKKTDLSNRRYRLVIFIEDSSESAYIVPKRETKMTNPLLLKQFVEILLKYKEDIWGVIITTGNERDKEIAGCTIEELQEKIDYNKLFDADAYEPFEKERNIYISRERPMEDSDTIVIRLFDRMNIH